MTNSTEFANNATYQMPATEVVELPANGQVTLKHTPVANTISIYGGFDSVTNSTLKFQETTGDSPTSGTYKLSGSTITFLLSDFTEAGVTDKVTISYMYETSAREANIDNRSSAIGEAILVYPVASYAALCCETHRKPV